MLTGCVQNAPISVYFTKIPVIPPLSLCVGCPKTCPRCTASKRQCLHTFPMTPQLFFEQFLTQIPKFLELLMNKMEIIFKKPVPRSWLAGDDDRLFGVIFHNSDITKKQIKSCHETDENVNTMSVVVSFVHYNEKIPSSNSKWKRQW